MPVSSNLLVPPGRGSRPKDTGLLAFTPLRASWRTGRMDEARGQKQNMRRKCKSPNTPAGWDHQPEVKLWRALRARVRTAAPPAGTSPGPAAVCPTKDPAVMVGMPLPTPFPKAHFLAQLQSQVGL